MKRYIKLEYALMKDERIRWLIEDIGLKGFGVYVMLRLLVECCDDGVADFGALVRSANAYAGRRVIMSVLTDYDLFEVDGSRVRVCVDGRTDTPADTRADTRADVHFPLSGKLEKEGEGNAPTPTCEANDRIDAVREWLLDDKNLVWREPMQMQSGYAELLSRHWTEAVEFFITHMLAQDKLDSMFDSHETKMYFTNFSRINTASGRSLKQHLEQLEQKTMTNEQIRRALGYE